MSTLVSGKSLRICRVASNPLSSGIAMSITTTAGRSFRVSCDRLAAGLRFADHFDVAFVFQATPKTLADDLVVFSQQDSDSFHKSVQLASCGTLAGRGMRTSISVPARRADLTLRAPPT